MEINAAVTLHFENLAVQNNLFLKDVHVHLLMKNLKLFTKALLMNVKFFFLNILKSTHDRVQEIVKKKMPYLAPCYTWSSKYLIRKTSQSSKVLF